MTTYCYPEAGRFSQASLHYLYPQEEWSND